MLFDLQLLSRCEICSVIPGIVTKYPRTYLLTWLSQGPNSNIFTPSSYERVISFICLGWLIIFQAFSGSSSVWPPCESDEKDGKDPSGLISGGEREMLMCIASGPWKNGQNKSLNGEMPLPSCDNKKIRRMLSFRRPAQGAWEEYVENSNRVEASREQEIHLLISQCPSQFWEHEGNSTHICQLSKWINEWLNNA